jgi:hypothetical protein
MMAQANTAQFVRMNEKRVVLEKRSATAVWSAVAAPTVNMRFLSTEMIFVYPKISIMTNACMYTS